MGLLLQAPTPAFGAPLIGFPLQASQTSPVTGAVTISAPAVLPELGLTGVQFKVDGYVLNALDTTAPFQALWSAASATDGVHTITADVSYASGVVIESAPLVLTVANQSSFNRTLHVDAAAGNDANNGLTPATAWRTLGRANTAVVAGDTVLLRGTFTGQLISPAVSGTAAAPIRFASYAGTTAVLNAGGGAAVALGGRSYIVVERLRIQNSAGYAVALDAGAHHNVIRDCYLTGNYWSAIAMIRSNDNLVERNQIIANGDEVANAGDSIWIADGSNRNRILDNTLQDGGHTLIQIGGDRPGEAAVGDNVVARNTLSNFYTTPLILSWMARRTLIEHNRVSDAARNGVNFPRPGLQIQGQDSIIRYNEIFDNAGAGLFLAAYVFNGSITQEAVGNQIYHNVFYGNNLLGSAEHPGAIEIMEKNGLSVRNNLIANNVFFRNAGFAFNGSRYAISVDQYNNDCASWPSGNLNGNRIKNNIFLRQPGSAGEAAVLMIRAACQGGNRSYTLAALQQQHADASGNREVDPLFTDEANRVFTLRAGSAAIDNGLVIPGIAFLGTAPDLGVFEFDGGGPPDTVRPTVTLVSPTAGQTVAGTVTLTVSAADNVGTTRIDYLVDGALLTVTSPPSSTFAWDTRTTSSGAHSLSARAHDAAGNVGTSAPVTVTVANPNPAPTLTSLSPASRLAGGAAFTLTVDGTGFAPASVVRWNGIAQATTFVSAARLTAAVTAAGIATPGTAPVTVFTPSPGGGTSAARTFTIDAPVPATSSLSPANGTAGGAAFTLTVNGTNFVAASQVRWNGTARTTTFVSGTQLRAALTAADLAAARAVLVSVFTPTPGGGTSGTLGFTVTAVPAVPVVSSLSPASVNVGSAGRTLRVNGSGFVASSVVRWNGAARTTTFVNASRLRVALTASDLVTVGSVPVSVVTPAPGGGTSGTMSFAINGVPVPPPVPGVTPGAPPQVSVTPLGTDASGATFAIAWGAGSGATSYRYTAAFNDGAAAQQGTVTGLLSFQLRMAYHASGTAFGGFVCVRSVSATGLQSADHSCNAVPVPARPPAPPVPVASGLSPAGAVAGSRGASDSLSSRLPPRRSLLSPSTLPAAPGIRA